MNQINKIDFFKKAFNKLIVVFLLIVVSDVPALAQKYIWPTNASRLLTSSFCEFRPRRYHAGYDVKTWGKEGYPVFAMADGYIWRIRISPNGYGKAVYVKHANGDYTVYAHLQQFHGGLESFIREQQIKSASYMQEFYFKPDQYPVKQGDTIAYTGSTGIGYPHLHFEIRDRYHRPINPGIYFKEIIPDHVAPLPLAMAFVPLEFQTSINQGYLPIISGVKKRTGTSYKLDKTIHISGPFYMAFKVKDYMEGAFNSFNVFRAILYMDGKEVVHIEFDTLSYSYNHHSQLYFDYTLEKMGFRRFQKLMKHSDFGLPFYKKDRWQNVISGLSPGLHRFELILEDISGNVSSLNGDIFYTVGNPEIKSIRTEDSLTLMITSNNPIESIEITNIYKRSPLSRKLAYSSAISGQKTTQKISFPLYELKGYVGAEINIVDSFRQNYKLLYVNPLTAVKSPVIISDYHDFSDHIIVMCKSEEILPDPVFSEDKQSYVSWSRTGLNSVEISIHKSIFTRLTELQIPFAGADTVTLHIPRIHVIPAKTDTTLSPPEIPVQLEIGKSALYGQAYISMQEISSDLLPLDAAYPMIGNIYKIQPFQLETAEPLIVRIPFQKNYLSDHIYPAYFEQKKNKWMFLPSSVSSDSLWFECPVFSLEYFGLIQDTIAPEIRLIYPKSGKLAKGKGIVLFVDDEYSGIQHIRDIEITLNGKKQLFEWDPEEHEVVIPEWSFQDTSIFRLNITVTDGARNARTKTYQFSRP